MLCDPEEPGKEGAATMEAPEWQTRSQVCLLEWCEVGKWN